MLAYHNKPEMKTKALDIMAAHRKAETLAQNHGYWHEGKGCAVGCLLHELSGQPDKHTEYERLLGIPASLAHLEDRIFETLPEVNAQDWPEQFLGAIEPGADLSIVTWQFLDWLLSDLPKSDNADVTAAIEQVRKTVLQPLVHGEAVERSVIGKATRVALRAGPDTIETNNSVKFGSASHTTLSAFVAADCAHAAYTFKNSVYATNKAVEAAKAAEFEDANRIAMGKKPKKARKLLDLKNTWYDFKTRQTASRANKAAYKAKLAKIVADKATGLTRSTLTAVRQAADANLRAIICAQDAEKAKNAKAERAAKAARARQANKLIELLKAA